MPVRRIPVNEAESCFCYDVLQEIRANAALPQIVRHLRVTTIGNSDLRWYAALQAESQARASSALDARAARLKVNTMLRAARVFFATVLDGDAHRVPRVLASAMGGVRPSALGPLADREKIHALRSLITFISHRRDLSFNADDLAALAQAVEIAEPAVVQAIVARGAWHATVTAKKAETRRFKAGYRAFVGALRSTGGPERLRQLLPGFAGRARAKAPGVSPEDSAEVDVQGTDEVGPGEHLDEGAAAEPPEPATGEVSD